MGVLLAHELKLPLLASWHTNLHEFGARRLAKTLSFLPEQTLSRVANFTETELILKLSLRFYRFARVLLTPNVELLNLLQQKTKKPAFLMQRGVDTVLFFRRSPGGHR
jgi:phosphatidylinositol alpha 1,6-mannosyltransferase